VAFASLGVSRAVQFSLRVRTRSTAGLVSHCSRRTQPVADGVLLRLSGGRPRLIVNWGSGPLVVQSSVAVSDGRWHTLEVLVEPASCSLFVDGRRFDGRAHLSDANLLNLETSFYVGAVPGGMTRRGGTELDSRRGRSRRGIVGCVDRVRIRGRQESWRTVLASSPRATTECVGDVFRCSPNNPTCSAADLSRRQNQSADYSDVSPNTTFISVVEGDRAALSTEHIESISDRTLPEPDIRFRAAANQLHGRLSGIDPARSGNEIEFSYSDLARSRVWYIHDGSETTSDSIRLYAEQAGAIEELILPVNIIPANDPPAIRLPPNDTLTLVSNTRINLNSELLSAVDADDVSSRLQFNIYPSDDPRQDSGYFEVAATGGVRAKITRFTQRAVESGRVFYVHRGSATQSVLLDATDGKDTSAVKRLTVLGIPLAVFPAVNTGSGVPRGGNVVVGAAVLSFATNAPYLGLDIRYQVSEPPFYGELQKLVQYSVEDDDDDSNRMWTVALSFTQTQLDESRLRYVHDPDTVSREDYFLFRVSAVGAGQRVESDEEYHFRLTVVDCTVDSAASRPVFVQGIDRYHVITSGALRFVSNFRQHGPDDIFYRIRSVPRLGDLYVDRQVDRNQNYRRHKLTVGDNFTQADVDGGRLAYRMNPVTGPANDTIEFDVLTSCASGRRHVLSLRYRATTGNVRLINVGLTNVREGGIAVIGPENLNVEIVDDRQPQNFRFRIVEPTQHGAVQLMQTGNRNSAVAESNATTFSIEDVASGRVRYVHDDSETRNDSFAFTVSESVSGDVALEPEVVIGDRFSIDVALQNDNVPRRVNAAVVEAVYGVGRRLAPEHLKYADADVDTTQLDFSWEAEADGVELAMTDDRWTPLYHFTQADVDAGRIYVHHDSGTENVVDLWVSDGVHFVTGSLVVRASEPFVKAGNGTGLSVTAGQSAVVSAANLGFASNIDADLADVVFQVSSILEIDVITPYHAPSLNCITLKTTLVGGWSAIIRQGSSTPQIVAIIYGDGCKILTLAPIL